LFAIKKIQVGNTAYIGLILNITSFCDECKTSNWMSFIRSCLSYFSGELLIYSIFFLFVSLWLKVLIICFLYKEHKKHLH